MCTHIQTVQKQRRHTFRGVTKCSAVAVTCFSSASICLASCTPAYSPWSLSGREKTESEEGAAERESTEEGEAKGKVAPTKEEVVVAEVEEERAAKEKVEETEEAAVTQSEERRSCSDGPPSSACCRLRLATRAAS